ncbi:MAG TPA: DUF1761 domain-containing protein [Thermoanaerobaculia bacterium]|nr:DUF1761 domain-containing protein [Thermoanaerobaculia bacterium]
MNWLAVLVAALAYWFLGAIWYSALFGKVWASGLEQQGIKIQAPTKSQMITKLVVTLVANLVTAVAIGHLAWRQNLTSAIGGVHLGLITGIGIAATTLAVAYSWESKPMKNLVIDSLYHLLGCIIVAVILAVWH